MWPPKKVTEKRLKLLQEKETLLFAQAEFANNLDGIEVYLKLGDIHIGSIRYSKPRKIYTYRPDKTHLIQYTDNMVEVIAHMVKTATETAEEKN